MYAVLYSSSRKISTVYYIQYCILIASIFYNDKQPKRALKYCQSPLLLLLISAYYSNRYLIIVIITSLFCDYCSVLFFLYSSTRTWYVTFDITC
jgi:uncharacterized membrane protein